jgi:hypothetical protein
MPGLCVEAKSNDQSSCYNNQDVLSCMCTFMHFDVSLVTLYVYVRSIINVSSDLPMYVSCALLHFP